LVTRVIIAEKVVISGVKKGYQESCNSNIG
jgi:hypothetical protein